MIHSRLLWCVLCPAVLLGADDAGPSWYTPLVGFGHDTLVDTGRTVTAPVRWDGTDWLVFGGCSAVVITAMTTVDRRIRTEVQDDRGDQRDRSARYANRMGTIWSLGAIGGVAVGGWLADDATCLHAARDALEATIITSGVVVPALKLVVGRSRPDHENGGADDFSPFSGNYSFPSGHTAQAFTVAAVMARSWSDRWYVGAACFAVATTVGLARINDDQHYASDVLAGAAIGTAIGWGVVGWNDNRRGVQVNPSIGRRTVGLSAEWCF